MGIIFKLSKLLDELSLQYCEVSLEYCTVFMCRSTHTQMEREAEAQRERERESGGNAIFLRYLVFGHFLIEHIFFCPEQLKGSHRIHLFTHKLLPVPPENPVTSEQTHRSILPQFSAVTPSKRNISHLPKYVPSLEHTRLEFDSNFKRKAKCMF